MSWSKLCRILNLIACIIGIVLWFGGPAYCYVTGHKPIEYGFGSFFFGMACYWFARAIWEIGTVKRIRGQINDKTLIE